MVKRLVLALDDDVFERLKKAKGEKTWEQFILTLLNQATENKKEEKESR